MTKRNVCPILWPFPLYFGLIFQSAWWTPKSPQIDLKFVLVSFLIYYNGISNLLEKKNNF